MDSLRILKLLVLSCLLFPGCILPPSGIAWPAPRPLTELAEHDIKVNQVGYFPSRIKLAVLTTAQTEPQVFILRHQGTDVYTGQTTVFGMDSDSGDPVHHIDFTDYRMEGDNFTLHAGAAHSVPFSIRANLYRPLHRDALRYFYLNRSGMPLEMPFTEDRKAARPAGHLSDTRSRCEQGQRCDHQQRKDVSGGWYDAGDYGKYVVNGGLSVWLLMHAYEHLHLHGDAQHPPLNLNIPESGNDVPDILDEARFQMEWMLKMQVTDGPEKGLVHHMIRNREYTGLPHLPPTQDPGDPPRFLRDTGTSATLNLAASGALCARVFAAVDSSFADQCRAAAQEAFAAALRFPDIAADAPSYTPYGDKEMSDEFFWAAAELWVTTGDPLYMNHLKASRHYGAPDNNAGGSTSLFNWQQTDGLGAIALATAIRDSDPSVREIHRNTVIEFADHLLSLIDSQGYRMPMSKNTYPWGSNSFVLNNAIVLLLAHEFTENDAYLDGAVLSMDYILGRNPLDFSYVSGYGQIHMRFPHHRFFAPSYDNRLPLVPPGSIAGGPNASMQDNAIKSYRTGCPPAKCYVDAVESYSTNEVAINWNAALAWVAAVLDEKIR